MGDLIPEAQVNGLLGLSLTAFTFSNISAIFNALSLSCIMPQNYKVFIDDSFVFFHVKNDFQGIDLTNFEKLTLPELKNLICNKSGFVYSNSNASIVSRFFKKFSFIEASGGIIEFQNKFLMIFRLGKWDFPKGKIEANESAEEAAIRESIEECGLQGNLKITSKLKSTFHCYQLNGKDILKKTHWFFMEYKGPLTVIPQVEENIETVRWVSKKELIKNCNTSYASLKDLCEYFMYEFNSSE